mgnify:CR=1 FL=1
MSRIGKNPIIIPDNVKIQLENNLINISGPKGVHTWSIHEKIKAELKDNTIIIDRFDDTSLSRSLHGTTRQIVNNMVIGVAKKFDKRLELKGVGYRCQVKNNIITLNLGYSHPIEMQIPGQIDVKVENNTSILVTGIEKEKVGLFASQIRGFRPPEPYNGKGVLYKDEVIIRKLGKVGK